MVSIEEKRKALPWYIKVKHRIQAFFILAWLLIKNQWDTSKAFDELVDKTHKERMKLWKEHGN